jgi:hypothetical protein
MFTFAVLEGASLVGHELVCSDAQSFEIAVPRRIVPQLATGPLGSYLPKLGPL